MSLHQDTIIQDLIRTTMQRLSAKSGRTYISKKKILKILYLAKGKMSEGNPVKELLAYYWYLERPYSEVVYAGIDQLVSDNRVIRMRGQQETYQFDPSIILVPLAQPDEHIDEARRCISEVVSEFAHIESTVSDIYGDAPYEWYKTYKQEFKVKFDNFCNTAHREEQRYAPQDILNLLDDAVLECPPLSEFGELRMIFMDFAKILNAFLRSENYVEHLDKLSNLQKVCDEIWTGFAYRVRVKVHDEYYDDRVDEWNEKYKMKLDTLNKDILKQEKIFDKITQDNRRFVPEIEDIVLHPERHTFKPFIPNTE